MTIQDIGSIGELLAAIATIATLIYLAAQIRQNTQMLRANSATVHTTSSNAIATILAQDAELCELYFRGLAGTFAFAAGQQKQFEMLLGVHMNHLQQNCELEDHGLLSQNLVTEFDAQVSWLCGQPGFTEYWKEWSATHSPAMRERVARAQDTEK